MATSELPLVRGQQGGATTSQELQERMWLSQWRDTGVCNSILEVLAQLEIPEAPPAPSSPHLSAHLEAASCVPAPDGCRVHMEQHPHPVPQVPALCHGDVPKTSGYPGFSPSLAKVSKAEIPVSTHTLSVWQNS